MQSTIYLLLSLRLCLCIFLSFSCTLILHTQPDVQWAINTGGIGIDAAHAVVIDDGGNVYTTGAFMFGSDFDPGFDKTHLYSNGGWDAYVSKHDSYGNLVWAVSFGDTLDDWGIAITRDGRGGIYISGNFRGTVDFNPGLDSFDVTAGNFLNTFLLKLDEDGNFIWVKTFGGGYVSNQHITANTDGTDFYLIGNYLGTVDFDPGPDSLKLTAVSGALYIANISYEGELIWVKNFVSGISIQGFKTAFDHTSKRLYASGVFSATADFDPGVNVFELTANALNDVFVLCLDQDGNFIWARSVGGQGYDRCWTVDVNYNGNGEVYLTGSFEEEADFNPDPAHEFMLESGGEEDAFVLKLDNEGNFLWAKSFSGQNVQRGTDLLADPSGSGDVYVTGEFRELTFFEPGDPLLEYTSDGFQDVFLIRISNEGIIHWVKVGRGPEFNSSRDIALDADRYLYMCGDFVSEISFDFFTLTNDSDTLSTDAFVVRFTMLEPTSLTESVKTDVDIFPNPVSDELTISFDNKHSQPAEVQIFNALGEKVFIEVDDDILSSKSINMKSLPPGVYLVNIRLDGQRVVRKVVKK